METVLRKPFQGVGNIIRFNWHFYAIAALFISLLLVMSEFFYPDYRHVFLLVAFAVVFSTTVSLFVSYYVYDVSDLYNFTWTEKLKAQQPAAIVNIHAGFDETSAIISHIFPRASLFVFDFYDAAKHTEVSIARARKAYAPFPGTISINTANLPLKSNNVGFIFNIFALHEIRNREERIAFLKMQKEKLKPNGRCIVVEHLRNVPNFLAYNIGFFHFLSQTEWLNNFREAGLAVVETATHTPFVSVFILKAK
jgi:hypothetical protein